MGCGDNRISFRAKHWGIESLDDRDISFGEVDNAMCLTIIIRCSKTDRQKLGVRRSLAATGCDMCSVQCMVQWLDLKGWHPSSGESLFRNSISARINRSLKEIADEHGIDSTLIPTHSLRAGCATTLYSAGIDPIDIQRWGRRKSSIYMRYIWHDNLRLHHLSTALTAPTQLTNHLKVDLATERKVNFDNTHRTGREESGKESGPHGSLFAPRQSEARFFPPNDEGQYRNGGTSSIESSGSPQSRRIYAFFPISPDPENARAKAYLMEEEYELTRQNDPRTPGATDPDPNGGVTTALAHDYFISPPETSCEMIGEVQDFTIVKYETEPDNVIVKEDLMVLEGRSGDVDWVERGEHTPRRAKRAKMVSAE